jgi:hypothetical protein
MSCLGTAVILVLVLQNSMDLLKGELDSSSETCVTSSLDINEVTGIEAERISVIKVEEDQEGRTIPVIKTEPKVSYVPGVSVTRISYRLYQNCLPVYQYVLKKQKFDSRKWISSSFKEWTCIFCYSQHVQYHLQWNVLSMNKSNMPFIFMGVKCNLLH